MYLNIELNSEYESKLVYVQQRTDQKDLKAVIEAAIDIYYQQLEPTRKTALQLLTESGFIGCVEADENLSTNYKQAVSTAIQQCGAKLSPLKTSC
jgi:DNA primase